MKAADGQIRAWRGAGYPCELIAAAITPGSYAVISVVPGDEETGGQPTGEYAAGTLPS
jgi:hypothetical protein